MVETITIEASDEEVAREIGFALMGRAADIHDNPDNDHEDLAEELRDYGQALFGKYE